MDHTKQTSEQHIHWYPGHMTKARRIMMDNIKLIDVVIELVDARAPYATRNPDFDDLFSQKKRVILLNKMDLADDKRTKAWLAYYRGKGYEAMGCIATQRNAVSKLGEAIQRAVRESTERSAKKGVHKTVRAMVAGIPNVGKSTLINAMSNSGSANVGNRPGVTRGKQWVKISPYLELLDTPGLLWPKLEDQRAALHLAFLGAIRDEILDTQTLAAKLMNELFVLCPAALLARYKKLDAGLQGEALLEAVCASRGFLLSGGVYDVERAANTVLEEFRSGKIARVSLEAPADDKAVTEDKT